jgi:HlyD family secretion protein
MKKKIIAAIILIILGVTFVWIDILKRPNPNEITLFGNIEIRQVDLSFQVSGIILKLLKEEGDAVQKGELVAILDERDYKANFDSAQARASNAVMLYERQTPLCSDATISKQDCDTLTNNRDEAVSSRDFAKNQLDYTKVYAPANGVIMTRVQEPGAVVAQGQPVYVMAKDKPVWIRAYIPETHLGNIKYGMKARVLTDSKDPNTGKKREYTGWVGYISPVAEFTPKTVQTEELRTDLVYRIRVYVFETDQFLRQGMPTTVKINLHESGGKCIGKTDKCDAESEINENVRREIEESE